MRDGLKKKLENGVLRPDNRKPHFPITIGDSLERIWSKCLQTE